MLSPGRSGRITSLDIGPPDWGLPQGPPVEPGQPGLRPDVAAWGQETEQITVTYLPPTSGAVLDRSEDSA
ncbi:hypothetical protein GCM10027569_51650 [Flindersiella endophytica]